MPSIFQYPTLTEYTTIDKGAILTLHKLLFDVVHKIIIPRKQKRTEANYLDLTLMELLLSKLQINLHALILSHIHGVCVLDEKKRALAYGFLLGMVFKYFNVPVTEWQIQSISDVLGEMDLATIPENKKGTNVCVQRLKSTLTAKDQEINTLIKAHSEEWINFVVHMRRNL